MLDLYNDDSLKILQTFPDCSIDICITDPPYFINGMGADWNREKLKDKINKAKIIGSLPVGMRFDPKQGVRLQEFMAKVSSEIFRVLKPGAFFLSFSQGRLYHRMAMAIEDCGFEIRDMLIWQRDGQAKAFSQDHFVDKMDISDSEKRQIKQQLMGRKTPQVRGVSEPIVLAQKPKEGTFVENWLKYGVGLIDTGMSQGFPSTIFNIKKPNSRERGSSTHPTMKPIELMKQLVQIFTKAGDIIIDPFMGSGSTGIACMNLGRRFIGIEKDDIYFNEAKSRINSLGSSIC